MAITDPEAIKFLGEQLRPLAEAVRALDAKIDAAEETWARLASLFPDNAQEVVDDGRESTGVSRVSGKDVRSMISVLSGIRTALAGRAAVIEKPCVRPLRIEIET